MSFVYLSVLLLTSSHAIGEKGPVAWRQPDFLSNIFIALK
jgi:hypothetical protein